VQGIKKFLKHLGIGGHGYILIRRDFCVAMRKQIHSYAATNVG